ncbi:hypothetical protein BW732_09495 [Vagococcus penaei]|uniref:5-bromo-4-chloroindolyl phosphate hydrolysis protein n=1 Tax=Vagococcus penaei TaxID=633807 RepID=A0A1Q2D7R3_9ENTE|nr:5-bromo-4-chloroindolyl phosphate hydrolysis family protein [Vagococcus penaei]AQP54438.1 hypothetical protein BW732_09495 [Vagococcus penaei]
MKKKSLIGLLTIVMVLGLILGQMFDDSIVGGLFSLAFFISAIWLVVNWSKKRRRRRLEQQKLPSLSRNKEEHYSEIGMSDSEIKFFRQTMAETKEQIVTLEKNMTDVTKLRTIDLKYQTVKASKAVFKELVKKPQKLHQANDFLYTHLPNIVELTNRYVEINNHDIKNKQTYDALTKCVGTIESMSTLIVDDYNNLVKDDLEDLDLEIKLAQQNAERTAKEKNLNDLNKGEDVQ